MIPEVPLFQLDGKIPTIALTRLGSVPSGTRRSVELWIGASAGPTAQ